MQTGFEFDRCLQAGSGLGEALDAAGIDCRAPACPAADSDDAEPMASMTQST